MASSGPPRSPDANPTRQMLDELDALMERMLALPVNELEDSPQAPPAPPPIKISRSETLAPEPPHRALPEPHRPPSPAAPAIPQPAKIIVGRLSAPSVPSHGAEVQEPGADENKTRNDKPFSFTDEQATESAALLWPESNRAEEDILPPLVVKPASVETLRRPSKRRSLSGLLLQPVFSFNHGFDRFTHLFGGLGRWLRSAQGRKILGVIGLVLLALAGLWWFHDWMGWNWIKDPLE